MKKILLLLSILLLGITPASAVEEIPNTPAMKNAMFNGISANMACQCGCGTTVKDCPHAQCGFAVPFREEMHKLINSGLSEKEVVAELVSNHGEIILAMPAFKGFNTMAFIIPFAAIFVVGYGILLLIRNWSGVQHATVVGNAKSQKDDPYLKRMREELNRFED